MTLAIIVQKNRPLRVRLSKEAHREVRSPKQRKPTFGYPTYSPKFEVEHEIGRENTTSGGRTSR
jgi:hypothetical protein